MFCMSCGFSLPDGAAFCPNCGKKVSWKIVAGADRQTKSGMNLILCAACGSNRVRKVRKGEYLCEHCGSRMITDEQDNDLGQEAADIIVESILAEGIEYSQKGDYQKSLQVLARGLDIEPDNFLLLIWIGKAYYKLHNLGKALEYFVRAEQVNPNDPSLISNFALVYFTKGNFQTAKQYYEKALDIIDADPSSATTLEKAITNGNYGYCIGLMGDKENAKKYLSIAKAGGYYPDDLANILQQLELDLDD